MVRKALNLPSTAPPSSRRFCMEQAPLRRVQSIRGTGPSIPACRRIRSIRMERQRFSKPLDTGFASRLDHPRDRPLACGSPALCQRTSRSGSGSPQRSRGTFHLGVYISFGSTAEGVQTWIGEPVRSAFVNMISGGHALALIHVGARHVAQRPIQVFGYDTTGRGFL